MLRNAWASRVYVPTGLYGAWNVHCGCGGRRFLSKKERIEMLEEYLESLKSEMEGVEEELKELKKE